MTDQTATFTSEGHTPVLIEEWLPIRELGIESVREAAPIPGQFPKLKTLHVWWARAPLAAASGVTLAAVLPLWSENLLTEVRGLPEALERVRSYRKDLRERAAEMSNSDWYRVWVLWISGVWGDPVESMRLSAATSAKPSFSWPQAYKNRPSVADLSVLHQLLISRWGHLPRVLDPTAGGGSIPYTSLRFGLPTWANDLNPVAVGVLEATLRAPAESGESILADVKRWGEELAERLTERLVPYFALDDPTERVTAYVLTNTVSCPRTGGPIPLAPNWWLDRSEDGTAVRLEPVSTPDGRPDRIIFHIDSGPNFMSNPDVGTLAGGDAVSPWDGLVVDGDYIKSQAREGKMWPTLYAVAIRHPKVKGRGMVRSFRAPTATDLDAIAAAEAELLRLKPSWELSDIIPTEDIPEGNKTSEPRRYGASRWRDLFTPRQLLVHGIFVEEWQKLYSEVVQDLGRVRGDQAMALLAMMQAKGLSYSSRQSILDPTGRGIRNAFQRHDLAFKSTFAEFDAGRELWPWALNQVLDAYESIAEQMRPDESSDLFASDGLTESVPGPVVVSSGSAAALSHVQSRSIELVNIDPPYYDNVMYAELADFFYVWEKRTLGKIFSERFSDELTNKDDEAVANPTRFADSGKRRTELAAFDYQQKMQAIFAECHRVLVEDGVMVVWFTHKRAEAWDTLGTSMMEAGFTIEASWPVATQSLTSLHHAKKNSAKSTIMLVCRKRRGATEEETFFEDIEAELRQAARAAVEKFEAEVGVGGVDLQLATYGPTLSVISRNWPVLSSEPDETGRSRRLRPEEALDVARQEVARLRMQRLVGKDASFDAATDFWLMCWETFQAREFPFDEARKLALGVGYDVEEAIKSGLLGKKAGNVELVSPVARGRSLRKAMDDTGRLPRLVDALHLMLVTYRDDKLAAARTWLADSGYGDEQQFLDVVQAAVNAVPRVRGKKGLTVEEAILLEDAVVGLFGDEITLPVEAEEQVAAAQMTLEG